jgi:2-dehydro-3-deoxyphosphogluconate aldolase / (4S)-4-hydroxy-2-oxoglutarate aldolase
MGAQSGRTRRDSKRADANAMGASRDSVIHALTETGVIAVVRIEEPAELFEPGRALSNGGVRFLEITMTVPGALRAIEETVSQIGDEVLIGAGTVLDPVTARLAISAGASFVVAPSLDEEVIAASHLYGVAAVPGCLTPTEIARAWRAGADIVKLFPGRVATPGYFADLKGPFPQVRMMPTGNVDLQTAPEYIRAGAIAVGVGKALVDRDALRRRDWALITDRAKRFREAIVAARGQ